MNKNKEIKFYALNTERTEIPGLGPITGNTLAICIDKKEMVEYLDKLMKMTHREDYWKWCKENNKNVDAEKSWVEFRQKHITTEDLKDFTVVENSYTYSDLAAILRDVFDYTPVGCNFEKKYEYDFYEQKMLYTDPASGSEQWKVWQEVKKIKNLRDLQGWQ